MDKRKNKVIRILSQPNFGLFHFKFLKKTKFAESNSQYAQMRKKKTTSNHGGDRV